MVISRNPQPETEVGVSDAVGSGSGDGDNVLVFVGITGRGGDHGVASGETGVLVGGTDVGVKDAVGIGVGGEFTMTGESVFVGVAAWVASIVGIIV